MILRSTHLIISNEIESLDVQLNKAAQMHTWCANNNLTINKAKTVFMRITSNFTKIANSPLIKLDNKTITGTSETKFLGITIDSKSNWEAHVQNSCTKVSAGCYLIRRIINMTNVQTAKLVYFAYIQSRLQYGIIF
jgi:hypothetical protein